MSQKRSGQDQDQDIIVGMSEAARTASQSADQKATKSDDEKISVFWRVFGGTLLSMVALGTITLYNSISSSIAELRSDLNHEREARAELVKKDEFNTRTSSQYERIRSFEGLKAEFEGFKERVNANVAALDSLKKDTATSVDSVKKEAVAASDAVKKDAATIDVLKERVVALEAGKKDAVGLEVLKEKLTATVAELKSVHDEMVKIQQEQDRTKLSESERKVSRDAQCKQVEESLKELQRGLQDCREKLARMEGARSTPVEPKSANDSGAGTSKAATTAKPDGM
ncbi:MAG: hypothetical protein K8U57_17485 [Planctomycetes bacterium]|nr:hypothetical protein [Planctomycetota bacterium]